MNLVEKELTGKIIGAGMQVSSELECGFLESVYEQALVVALRDEGIRACTQVPLKVRFREEVVGEFYADVVVEDTVLLELKAAQAIVPEHEAQLLNYLRASGIGVGLFINFGRPRLQWKRFVF